MLKELDDVKQQLALILEKLNGGSAAGKQKEEA
jgi:hypothetical protein